MKAALSIVLTALLIILPVEQVLAQAAQQADGRVQQAVPSDGAAQLFRVPPLPENTVRLLGTSYEGGLLESSLSNREAVPGWDDWSNGERTLAVLALIGALAIGFYLLLRKAEQNQFDDGS